MLGIESLTDNLKRMRSKLEAFLVGLNTNKISTTDSTNRNLNENKEYNGDKIMRETKTQIFVSHSTKDQKIASCFIDEILIGVLEFKASEILCTSVNGTKIKSGENWRDSIKDSILNSQVILLLITPNYKQSEICLNEMGAVWACGKKVIPIIVEPITYKSVGVVVDALQIEILNKEESLDKIRDAIVKTIGEEKFDIASDRWSVKKHEFVIKLEKYLEENPFPPIISNDSYFELEKKYLDLRTSNEELINDKTELNVKIEKLMQLKDKEQVKEALIEDLQPDERLLELVAIVKNGFSKFKPIIRTIIYNDFSNQKLHFKYTDYKAEIDDAIARGYIDEEYYVNWETPQIRNIKRALSELDTFLEDNVEFCYDLGEKHDIDIGLKNLDFWETILEIKMDYNH